MNDEQRSEYLVPILQGTLWCQLMSEPGAGSDVGGITTRAVQDGDEWVINGQKVWTTAGHLSDMAICITRTDWDVPKYSGLTMFIVPMDTPGVSPRPLRQITGEAEFCETFLDDVRDSLTQHPGRSRRRVERRADVAHLRARRSRGG